MGMQHAAAKAKVHAAAKGKEHAAAKAKACSSQGQAAKAKARSQGVGST